MALEIKVWDKAGRMTWKTDSPYSTLKAKPHLAGEWTGPAIKLNSVVKNQACHIIWPCDTKRTRAISAKVAG